MASIHDPVPPTPITPTGMKILAAGQVQADISTTHEMLVALSILLLGGMLLVLVAGESKEAGNAIIAMLSIMLFVQAITKVNPFVQWVVNHPLTPPQP
jgi:hypothetical protein